MGWDTSFIGFSPLVHLYPHFPICTPLSHLYFSFLYAPFSHLYLTFSYVPLFPICTPLSHLHPSFTSAPLLGLLGFCIQVLGFRAVSGDLRLRHPATTC